MSITLTRTFRSISTRTPKVRLQSNLIPNTTLRKMSSADSKNPITTASTPDSMHDPASAVVNDPNVPNFGKAERSPTSEEQALLIDILKLYQLHPISDAYKHYDESATFHDPIGIANGLDSLKAQFNAMPSLFSESITKGIKVLDNPEVKPPSVQFAQSQLYKFRFPPGAEKLVESLVTLHVDPSNGLIVKHDEEWNAENNATSSDGFFGMLNEARKKVTAATVQAVVDTRPHDQQ